MTNIDPRNPSPYDPIEPRVRPFDPVDPGRDPLIDEPKSSLWGLIGGIAAVLILVAVLASYVGTGPSDDRAATSPGVTPPSSQSDPTSTGSVPRPQRPAPQQAPQSAPQQ